MCKISVKKYPLSAASENTGLPRVEVKGTSGENVVFAFLYRFVSDTSKILRIFMQCVLGYMHLGHLGMSVQSILGCLHKASWDVCTKHLEMSAQSILGYLYKASWDVCTVHLGMSVQSILGCLCKASWDVSK